MQQETKPRTKEELLEVVNDFYKYCEENLYIVDTDFKLSKLVPNRIQRQIIDYVIECLDVGRPIRIIVLKARKEGVSTIVEALIYWWTATHTHVNSKVIAHESSSSQTIYRIFQRYYDNSTPFFKPKTQYFTKLGLSFDTKEGNGIKSQMSTATAGNENVGRGDTIAWLHCSETSVWDNGTELMAGLVEAVPMKPNTAIFIESTANGMGGYFYDTWQAAKEGRSEYKPFFFAWFDHDEYRLPVPPDFKLTERELEWKREYDLDDEQIAWFLMKEKSFVSDPEKRKQEYPFDDVEAFLASGRPRFQTNILSQMKVMCRKPKYYDLMELKDHKIQAKLSEFSPLKVWNEPYEGHQYVIGADVAEGLDTGDLSVATVMDKETMQTVARWRGTIEPADFGDILEMLARWYNRALIGVEINNHGLTVVQRLRDRRYDNLYRRERGFDERLEEATAKLGWKTDVRTKPLMIDALAEAIHTRKIKDYDSIFIEECLSYVIDDRGRTNAIEGKHDDTVISTAIALQLFEWSDVVKNRRATPSKIPSKYREAKKRNRTLVKKRTMGLNKRRR